MKINIRGTTYYVPDTPTLQIFDIETKFITFLQYICDVLQK